MELPAALLTTCTETAYSLLLNPIAACAKLDGLPQRTFAGKFRCDLNLRHFDLKI